MKNLLLVPVGVICALSLGCQSNSSSSSPVGQITIEAQPKTSNYYTSDSSGSNGPSFQLITVSNTQNTSAQVKSIAFTSPNSSISIVARSLPLNETDLLYGNLPECSTMNGIGTTNTLSQNQSCGILLQGITYDPRKEVQKSQLSIQVDSGTDSGSNVLKTFALTNVTHVYASPNQNSLGTAIVSNSSKYILADCSNNTDSKDQPLTCTNALGQNESDNFLSNKAGDIRVFPNGNLILGGSIIQAGNFLATSSSESSVLICKPGTDECKNALASGTYFGLQSDGQSLGYISEIELNPNAQDSTFFVTGKFQDIKNGSNVIASGNGSSPNFIASCTVGGSCTNVMPGATVSSPTPGDNGIYGLAYNSNDNSLYFAGTFKYFTDANGNPIANGNIDYPIIACGLGNNGTIDLCHNYFDQDSLNSDGAIFGMNFLSDTNQIQVNSDSPTIGGQTATPNNTSRLSALCNHNSCSSSVSTGSGLTARGDYDSNAQIDENGNSNGGLFYISGNYDSVGTANILPHQGNFLAACKRNDIHDCFDVLGGGTNGAFDNGNYPDATRSGGVLGIVANVGAKLSIQDQTTN